MRACLAVFVVLLVPAVVRAGQDAGVELGAGAGYTQSLHGDLDFGNAAVSATARIRVSRHVAFEGQFGYWQYGSRDTFLTSRGETVHTRLAHGFPSVTASVLAVSGRDARVGSYGGGGVGMFYHRRIYEQSATSQFPAASNASWRVGVGAQAVGGVDVRVTSRVKVFGEFRFELQSFRDPGSSSYRVLGGIRVPAG